MINGRKKILIYNYGSLFPIKMMLQVRIVNLIKRLHLDHQVDVVTFCRTPEEIALSKKGLSEICNNFYSLKPLNPKHSIIGRKFYGLKHLFLYYLKGINERYASQNNKIIHLQLLKLIKENNYDIFQMEYWYLGGMIYKLKKSVFKVIDSIAMVEEIQETSKKKGKGFFENTFDQRMFKRSIKQQRKAFLDSNLVLAISQQGMDIMKDKYTNINTMLIPIGQDINHFGDFVVNPDSKTIVFYGTMGSQQNLRAFSRLWKKIIPLMIGKIPDLKLIVVGANPPEHIKKLHNGRSVIVTGFVDDPRKYLAKASLVLLPLETGSGFRGRVVELMAMGIPVVGTHNALDSIGMTNAIHGIISDKDDVLAEEAVKIMSHPELRDKMSTACRKFAAKKYSIEATVGPLSKYYLELETKQ